MLEPSCTTQPTVLTPHETFSPWSGQTGGWGGGGGGLNQHLLLVVGDDAADEVGVGVPQGGHELGQLLLVELAHRAEHALTGLEGTGHLAHPSHLVQAHDAVHWREGGRGRTRRQN